jgi:hypothetical protein
MDLITEIIGHSNWTPGKKYDDPFFEIFYVSDKSCFIFDKTEKCLYPSPKLAYYWLNKHQSQKISY